MDLIFYLRKIGSDIPRWGSVLKSFSNRFDWYFNQLDWTRSIQLLNTIIYHTSRDTTFDKTLTQLFCPAIDKS